MAATGAVRNKRQLPQRFIKSIATEQYSLESFLTSGKTARSEFHMIYSPASTFDLLLREDSVMKRTAQKSIQHGQGMTEYIIIVALIAVAAIAVYQLFGATVRNQTAGIALEVAGGNGQPAIDKAKAAATKAGTVAADAQKNSLSTYGNQAEAGQQGGQ